MAVKATKLSVSLPFELGKLEFEPNEVEQRAAWSLYVELTTRIATEPLDPIKGSLREALNSLYSLFSLTREILREAGPEVAKGSNSFGPVAIDILNKGLRPFTTKWHPALLAYEQARDSDISALEHEQAWESAQEMRRELAKLQQEMIIYADVLAQIAGVE
jgi:hypothetical protein